MRNNYYIISLNIFLFLFFIYFLYTPTIIPRFWFMVLIYIISKYSNWTIFFQLYLFYSILLHLLHFLHFLHILYQINKSIFFHFYQVINYKRKIEKITHEKKGTYIWQNNKCQLNNNYKIYKTKLKLQCFTMISQRYQRNKNSKNYIQLI